MTAIKTHLSHSAHVCKNFRCLVYSGTRARYHPYRAVASCCTLPIYYLSIYLCFTAYKSPDLRFLICSKAYIKKLIATCYLLKNIFFLLHWTFVVLVTNQSKAANDLSLCRIG